MKRTQTASVLVVIGLAFAPTASQAGDAYGPYNLQSGKVHKLAHQGGKTAHRSQTYAAGPDRYFVEGSWRIRMISANGKNAGCNVTRVDRTPVTVTLPSGAQVTHTFATRFVVAAHAETGSKFGQEKSAWAECEVSATTQEFR